MTGELVTPGSVAAFAALLADHSRASMCLALLDGRAWTAGELAREAGIAASTASEHLSALVGAGLLTERRQGRHRYVCLAGPPAAQLIEDLATVAGVPTPTTSLRTGRRAARLRAARTCYDHLAGALGVALFDALVTEGWLTQRDGLALTDAGHDRVLGFLGSDVLQPRGRPFLRVCLDWTERRSHLGGVLGTGFLTQMVDRGWVLRNPGDRAVAVTPAGVDGLRDLLGVGVV